MTRNLSVESSIGVALTESHAMTPAASVCSYVLAHPQAKYFGLGRIGPDQLEDYAVRSAKDQAVLLKILVNHLP